MAADASTDLDGMAVGSVWADVASEKKCSLYCNGKKVTPEEDAVQLGSNKTQVPLCVLALYATRPLVTPALPWCGKHVLVPSCAYHHITCRLIIHVPRQVSLHRSPIRCSVQPMP